MSISSIVSKVTAWVSSESVISILRSTSADKASKAIEGLLLYPAPHLRSDADASVGRDQTVVDVVNEETSIQTYLQIDKPGPALVLLDNVVTSLRHQVKLLALAYTKAQSDMNAIRMQTENQKNFTQSMGDAFKFQSYLSANFRNDVLNNPEMKTLEVAELIIEKLRGGKV